MTIRGLAVAMVAGGLALARVASAGADELAGRVVEVSAGDTLTVVGADRQRHIVRLAGIDAPEMAQRFGIQSRQSLAGLCVGKTAQVEERGLDDEGGRLGWVTCAGINANGEQVRRGMAWVDAPHVRPSSALYTLQGDARLARRGLWRDRHPVAPWVWRARGRH